MEPSPPGQKFFFHIPEECGKIASMEKKGDFLIVKTSKNRIVKVHSIGRGYECVNEKVVKLYFN